MSRIVLITGSPRRGGNTDILCDAFVKASMEKGNEVIRFDAGRMDLSGCLACDRCYSSGRACVKDDGFNDIAEAVLDADTLVFAMPLYWYSIPAQLKCVIDRLYSLVVGKKDVSGKRVAVIGCCEEDDPTKFVHVTGALKISAELMNWDYVGEVLVTSVLNKGDVNDTDGCTRVTEFAKTL